MVAISYRTRRLEHECTDIKEMKRRYPSAVTRKIMLRIAELRAAESVDALLAGPGRWEMLTTDRKGQWSGRLTGNWRLIIEPAIAGTTVLVVEITDYH